MVPTTSGRPRYVTYEKRDGVAVVTLNRPEKLNALSREVLVDLLEVLEAVNRDPEVRAVVIAGAGRGFCTGADRCLYSLSIVVSGRAGYAYRLRDN